jgi:hypothetical protein
VRIDNIVDQDFEVVVGDADGVDTSIQAYLFDHGLEKATVFCSGKRPRNNAGNWPVQRVETTHAGGSRAFFTAKDIRMAEVAEAQNELLRKRLHRMDPSPLQSSGLRFRRGNGHYRTKIEHCTKI